MRNDLKKTIGARARALTALVLSVCLLLGAVPALAASSVGNTPGSLVRPLAKTFIKLSNSVMFFTGPTYGSGSTVTPGKGTVWQLVSDDYYTHSSDGLEYYGVYYQSKRYNVLRSDVSGDIMTDAELQQYIADVVWKQPSYSTLKESMDLVGDIRVYALQQALTKLGFYTGAVDGDYGKGTTAAVKAFQKANGLGADGAAGTLTQPVIYAMASGSASVGGSTGGGSSAGGSSSGSVSGGVSGGISGGSVAASGSLITTDSVNLRKSATKSSARLDVVPKGVTLTYTDTSLQSGVTWYKVTYNDLTGWLMGTYVNASGSSASPAIGTVTITMGGTRVRKTPNGEKTGTLLAKGSVVDLLAQPTSAGGYTWYNIRTGSGLVGYVRGDCATASLGGGSGSITPSATKTFVRLPAKTALFTTDVKPASGYRTAAAGTVLQMVSTDTYTVDGVTYCSLYYNNVKHNAVYADVKDGIMDASELDSYILTLWGSPLTASLKRELDLVGDVRVYALQLALSKLGYYTGTLDGTYGGGTQSAVRNFQRKAKITVDGACGNETWSALTAQVVGGGSAGGSAGGSTGGITTSTFGTVYSVQKVTWSTDDNGASIFPKGTYATVMDVGTGKVFRIYRWSGGNHADCVPATASDTKTMCDIVGFPYNSKHPTSGQLSKIKSDGNKSTVTYTWPDFKNAFGGAKDIGSDWDRRPALLNVNGKVYPVSIYGFPHGFNGTDSFSKSRFNDNNQYFYAVNNYYGMMCVHFPGSTTHSSTTPDSKHQAAINTAYNYAKSLWPTLVK